MTAQFERFVQEGVYLRNWSPQTARIYRQAWRSFDGAGQPFSDDGVNAWIVRLRQRGVRAASVNAYVRSLNSFLSYLGGVGHQPLPAKVRQLREPKAPPKTLSTQALQAILRRRPTSFYESRIHALVVLLADTGVRINEALRLRMRDVDWDSLLLRVEGKGSKTRFVPFSAQGRQALYRFNQLREDKRVPGDILFGAPDSGRAWTYENCRRDLRRRFDGVTPHMFRHTFATRFIASGGSPFQLQRMLGHADIKTTLRYVHLQTDDLVAAHRQHAGVGKWR